MGPRKVHANQSPAFDAGDDNGERDETAAELDLCGTASTLA
jgi:hypothetical protein